MSKVDIELIIPKDKLNNFRYIQLKLCDVKCNILQSISKNLNISMHELINKYIPEMNKTYYNELYTKYNIDNEIDNKKEDNRIIENIETKRKSKKKENDEIDEKKETKRKSKKKENDEIDEIDEKKETKRKSKKKDINKENDEIDEKKETRRKSKKKDINKENDEIDEKKETKRKSKKKENNSSSSLNDV
jgi:hypothetical protein